MSMPNQLEKLKEVLKLVGESITRDEFVSSFKKVADAVAEARTSLSKQVSDSLTKLRDANDTNFSSIKESAIQEINKALKTQEQGMNFIYDKVRSLKDGKTPQKGVDYTDGYTPQKGVDYFDGQDGSPDSPDEIVVKLESLEGEDRLDASAIKNLPKFIENQYPAVISGKGPLWALQDVSISGITAGQSLQWDGDKWVAYTPAGGGGTPVWAEDLTPQGPGTAYTLAFTPIAGSVRLFRGGAYQSVANGDYSIAGANITLGTTTQTGEVLVVDYSH